MGMNMPWIEKALLIVAANPPIPVPRAGKELFP